MDCPNLAGCPFFNDRMESKPAIANILKKQYCQGDYQACARYIVKNATGECPGELWPNQQEKADALLAAR